MSTFGQQGCSQQPEQENYGIIFTGSQVPVPLPNEMGMIRQPIRVRSEPLRHAVMTDKLMQLDVPPSSALPSRDLPPQSRIDYRRMCEVQHSVRCKNVGLVDAESSVMVEFQIDGISIDQIVNEQSIGRPRRHTSASLPSRSPVHRA